MNYGSSSLEFPQVKAVDAIAPIENPIMPKSPAFALEHGIFFQDATIGELGDSSNYSPTLHILQPTQKGLLPKPPQCTFAPSQDQSLLTFIFLWCFPSFIALLNQEKCPSMEKSRTSRALEKQVQLCCYLAWNAFQLLVLPTISSIMLSLELRLLG